MWLTQLRIRQRKQKGRAPCQLRLRSSVLAFRKYEILRIHQPVALIMRMPLTNRIGAQWEIYHFTNRGEITPSYYSQIIARHYEQLDPRNNLGFSILNKDVPVGGARNWTTDLPLSRQPWSYGCMCIQADSKRNVVSALISTSLFWNLAGDHLIHVLLFSSFPVFMK